MEFGEAVRSGFRNYANFNGRAARSEYWYWVLFALIVNVAGGILDRAIFFGSDTGLFAPLISLALLLPGIAVAVRRMHDMDRTGWWVLIVLTGIGALILLIWFCFKGSDGPNRFGSDPLSA